MKEFKTILKSAILISSITLFTACTPRGGVVQPPNPSAHRASAHRITHKAGEARVTRAGAVRNWSRSSTTRSSTRSRSRSRSHRDNYNPSRPEPYSIESGQKDPEVLGPAG